MSNYYKIDLSLTDSQVYKLAHAIHYRTPVSLKIDMNKEGHDIPILLTTRQINTINSKLNKGIGFLLKLSKTQVSKMKIGGFLPAIAAALPAIGSWLLANVAPAIATGAVGALAGAATNAIIDKAKGNGLYPIGVRGPSY